MFWNLLSISFTLLIGIVGIFISIISIYYFQPPPKKMFEINLLAQVIISNIHLWKYNLRNDFDFERPAQRLPLILDDNKFTLKSLDWFRMNGNIDDKIYIERLIKNKFFTNRNNLKVAENVIQEIEKRCYI